MTAATLVYLSACAALVYSGFCRLVHTDDRTAVALRAAIWLLTVAALYGAAAVVFWGHVSTWPDAALALGMAAAQVVTSVLWSEGVPAPFKRDAADSGQ